MKTSINNKITMKLINFLILLILSVPFGIAQTTVNPAGAYSSYFGGDGNEWGSSIALDVAGNVYIAGNSFSTNLPCKNAFQANNAGGSDAFIAKLSHDMSEIIYLTYLGGNGYDAVYGIYPDTDGNLYALGLTSSPNFPKTKNAFDTVHNGQDDVFFIKMNSTGALVYSSYLGGSGNEKPTDGYLDGSLNLYITGHTNSVNFPTKSAFSSTYNGGSGNEWGEGGDVFVCKFNMIDNTLVFSTYLGGSDTEFAHGLAVDKESNVYVTGKTPSADFPVKNAFDSTYGGNTDGFITKLNDNGNQIIYSSFFGGNAMDELDDIKVNSDNEVYFTGGTSSAGLNCSSNAFYTSLQGSQDVVIGKINASGNQLGYLSYFGGNKADYIQGGSSKIHLLDGSEIILVGTTKSSNLPVSEGAFCKSFSGVSDVGDLFISKLDIENKLILYCSYFGGNKEEGVHLGTAILNDSLVYLNSFTSSTNLYTSPDALYKSPKGDEDVFLFRANINAQSPTSVKEISGTSPLQIAPNPCNDVLTLTFNSPSGLNATATIYNMNGKMVLQQTLYNPNSTIDLSGYPAGMYLIKVIADGVSYEEKILKE